MWDWFIHFNQRHNLNEVKPVMFTRKIIKIISNHQESRFKSDRWNLQSILSSRALLQSSGVRQRAAAAKIRNTWGLAAPAPHLTQIGAILKLFPLVGFARSSLWRHGWNLSLQLRACGWATSNVSLNINIFHQPGAVSPKQQWTIEKTSCETAATREISNLLWKTRWKWISTNFVDSKCFFFRKSADYQAAKQ